MRHRSLRRSGTALLLALVVVLAVLPGVVAADQRVGPTIVVGAGETVTGGLQGAAGSVVIDGRVDGDLQVAAGSVVINGEVTGNVEVGTGSLTLGEDAVIGGSLQAGAGSAVIAGTIEGDATVGAGSIRLADTARIGGDFEYDTEAFDQEDGAVVEGSVVRNPDLATGPDVSFALPNLSLLGFVYGLLVTLVLGAILLVVFPVTSRRVETTALSRPLVSGVAGLLALVGVPIVLVIVAITIVGIPLSIVGALLFGLVVWVGSVYGRIAVGAWLVDRFDLDIATERRRWVGLLVGVVLVALVGLVPFLGGLVELLVLLLGFGALALLGYERFRDRSGATPASDTSGSDGTEATDDTGRPAA